MEQVDYKEKYEDLIKRIKKMVNCQPTITKLAIESLFPELKESEDEIVIAALKSGINGLLKKEYNLKGIGGISFDRIIAWLEKQGEHTNFCNKIQVGDKVTRNEDGVLVNLSQLNRVAKKQGEQKHTDKVKPKFKVGDWIITNKNHIWHVDETPETTSYLYRLINQYGKVEVAEFEVVDKSASIFTIQDAKDGDVLSTSAGAFIYNGNNGGGRCPGSYCGINTLSRFQTGVEHHWTGKTVNPATKEQCDLLFQKMNEAGYEWDAEKKELRKISTPADVSFAELGKAWEKESKQGSAWSEEDEKTWKELIEEVKDQLDSVPAPDCRDKEDEKVLKQLNRWLTWLKSLRPQSQWRPSEEQMKALEAILTVSPQSPAITSALIELYQDLKKLKGE